MDCCHLIKWLEARGVIGTRIRESEITGCRIEIEWITCGASREKCDVSSESITLNGLKHATPLLKLHKSLGGPTQHRTVVIDAIMADMERSASRAGIITDWDRQHTSPDVLAERTQRRIDKTARALEEARRDRVNFV